MKILGILFQVNNWRWEYEILAESKYFYFNFIWRKPGNFQRDSWRN
jgi:hypothetical protein